MNLRQIFHLPCLIAVFFCVGFHFSISGVEFECAKDVSDTGYELTPRFVRFISGGLWPVIVDWEWLRSLQELGEMTYSKETSAVMEQSYRLIHGLDPFFFESYEQGSIGFMVLLKEPDAALRILDRAINVFESGSFPKEHWTRAFLLYLNRASVHGYQKQDFASAKRDFLKASEIPGAPSYLQSMKTWLAGEDSERVLAVRMLKILASNTNDPVLKAFYEEEKKRYE